MRVFTITVCLLFLVVKISAIPVIDVLQIGIVTSAHNAENANLEGFVIDTTLVPSLSEINDFSVFDVLYLDEHVDDLSNPFANKENDVRNAIISQGLRLIVSSGNSGTLVNTPGEIAFFNSVASIIGFHPNPTSINGAIELTSAGASNPFFTGEGIPGNNAINIADIDQETRHAYAEFGNSVVLAIDQSGNPVIMQGQLGEGDFILQGLEPLETGINASQPEKDFVGNELFTVIPEPSTWVFLLTALGALIRKRILS